MLAQIRSNSTRFNGIMPVCNGYKREIYQAQNLKGIKESFSVPQ